MLRFLLGVFLFSSTLFSHDFKEDPSFKEFTEKFGKVLFGMDKKRQIVTSGSNINIIASGNKIPLSFASEYVVADTYQFHSMGINTTTITLLKSSSQTTNPVQTKSLIKSFFHSNGFTENSKPVLLNPSFTKKVLVSEKDLSFSTESPGHSLSIRIHISKQAEFIILYLIESK